MIKRAFFFVLFLFTFSSISVYAAPQDVIIDEDFTTRSMIDEENTNAVVDTLLGEVKLPQVTGAQSMDANEDGILVIDDGSISFYSFDGSEFKYNPYLSHSTSGNPIAAALSPTGFEHYVLHADGRLTTYRFTGSSLYADPAYQLSDFHSALSVARSELSLFVLDNREVRTYKDLGNGLIEVESLNITLDDIDNPVQITTMGEDLVVLDGHENVHFYRYTGNGYSKDPAISILGAGTAVNSASGTIYSIQENRVDGFSYTGNQLIRNEHLSFSHSGAISISGLYENWTVFVRDGSSVSNYMFTGETMARVNTINGLSTPVAGYLTPRQMQTKMYTWPEPSKRVFVEVTAEKPEHTNIELLVSSDGTNFSELDDTGIVVYDNPSNSLSFKAILTTENPAETPILKNIRVTDKSLDVQSLETTRIVRDPGGNPPLPTEQPVRVLGGYNFDMRVTAPGAIEVQAIFMHNELGEQTLRLSYQGLNEKGEEIYTLIHRFPMDALGVFDVHIFAKDEDGNLVDRLFPAHYFIEDNIMNNASLYDIR